MNGELQEPIANNGDFDPFFLKMWWILGNFFLENPLEESKALFVVASSPSKKKAASTTQMQAFCHPSENIFYTLQWERPAPIGLP
jgi:hypothetical protein